MIKKLVPVLLTLILCASLSGQRPYTGSGRDFTRAEMGEVTATGGSVTRGYIGYISTDDTLRTATWSTDSLNQFIIGVGSGGFKTLRTTGVVETYTGACSTLGKHYWLGPAGSFLDSMPKLQNVWLIRMGQCVDTDKILLDILVMRREGNE